MKKFIFSAVAMVAFVGSSMANCEFEKQKELLTIENPCKATFSNALSYAYSQGADDDMAWQYASVAYTFCEAGFTRFF